MDRRFVGRWSTTAAALRNVPEVHATPTSEGREARGVRSPQPWDFRFCTPKIENLEKGDSDKNVLLCEVPETVVPGFIYKYNLDGAAEKDPDVEVRKGG